MRQTKRPPLFIGLYSDDPAAADSDSLDPESRYGGEIDYLLERDSIMLANRQRLPAATRIWPKSRGLPLRYVSRSRLILVLAVFLTVQITLYMLSEPTWMTIQPTIVLLDDRLIASQSGTVVILDRPSSEHDESPMAKTNLQAQLYKRPGPVTSHLEFLQGDASYLEAWVATGKVLPGMDFGKHDKIDGLWSWLNGSDPRHQAGLEFFANDSSAPSKPFPGANIDSRFRENDELRYSLRSAKAALGDYLRTSHIVSADYWPSGLPDDLASGNTSEQTEERTVEKEGVGQSDIFHVENGLMKYGQVPQWIDLQHPGVKVGDEARIMDEDASAPAVRIHHDWSIYSRLQNVVPETGEAPDPLTPDEAVKWKLSVLPTFNSGAKEASMGLNVTDLSDVFFYSNDDYYLGRNLSTADFASPLYGPVFLIARLSTVDAIEKPEDGLGEYPSYKYTAWLLGQRFGARKRSYIHHVHKIYIRPLVLESQLMFGDELGRTAAQRFRGGGRLVNNQLMSYNFIIERHREALLWSYFVARVDKDGDGVYSDDELSQAFSDLGIASEAAISTLDVPLPVRDTLHQTTIKQNFGDAHFSLPKQVKYVFSSQDGYALAELNLTQKFDNAWPDYSEMAHSPADNENPPVATMDWKNCWVPEMRRDPVQLLRHMAFEKPECGDQLVTLLVARSGRRGLSAFLPAEGTHLPEASGSGSGAAPRKPATPAPHLPLSDRWQDGDFTLQGVARSTGWAGFPRRLFAMLLIQRYAYTIGSTPLKFDMLTTAKSAVEIFENFRKAGGRKAHPLFGINDDMTDKEVEEASGLLQKWMEEMWPAEQFRLPFERR